jgi:glycosyltransferase involved in cell wall biosynthesis
VNPHILIAHNYYQQPGGEDYVYHAESTVLEREGHRVTRYEEDNRRIRRLSVVSAGAAAIWSTHSYGELQSVVRALQPDVAHFHNTFPLISPAAYYAVRREGVPVVQQLSNFRLLCPGATLLRDGKVCEECIERRSFLPAVTHRCYRNSRPATTAVVGMLALHRAARTWQRMVDVYVAATEFVRQKFIEGGVPPDRIMVKPHFLLTDPGKGEGRGNYALFAGRLSEEKGVRTLRVAWGTLPDIPLLVIGDGPLAGINWPRGVTWLGNQPRERVIALMKEARVLIVPSEWYEIGPLTVVEAFACGLPVIASDLGSMAERVEHHRSGFLFRPGDAEDLARQVRWAFEHPAELQFMRAAARREYEQKYTAERNYKMLIDIYGRAIENARRERRAAS